MPVARDGEQPLWVVAGDADRWRGPCLRSHPIPRVRGRYHVLSPTTGRRTHMKHWTDLFKLVVALLALAVLLPAPAALAGSSADEIKNCPDQNWCAYHRTVDTAWRHSPLTQVNTTNVKRSEEHTSELQSQSNLVCRLLLEKKKNMIVAVDNLELQDQNIPVMASTPIYLR